jgi:hypothetical protein
MIASLAGCALKTNVKDGKEYLGSYPVLFKGTVEDIRAADKAGVVHSVAAETASTAANGAGAIANIAQMTTGMSALGGGMIGATLSVFSGIIAGATAPAPPQLVVRKEDGTLMTISLPAQTLKERIEFECVGLGTKVKVVDTKERYPYVVNDDDRLRRSSAFAPSCVTSSQNLFVNKARVKPRPPRRSEAAAGGLVAFAQQKQRGTDAGPEEGNPYFCPGVTSAFQNPHTRAVSLENCRLLHIERTVPCCRSRSG